MHKLIWFIAKNQISGGNKADSFKSAILKYANIWYPHIIKIVNNETFNLDERAEFQNFKVLYHILCILLRISWYYDLVHDFSCSKYKFI